LAHAAWPFAIGIAGAGVLLVYEDRLFGSAENVFVLNERVFTANMAFSVVFLVTVIAGFTLGRV
jgi:hypothetical protein